MGNPDAGSSAYQHDQPQAEYDLQPQEYQYEATHEAIPTNEEFQYQSQPKDPQAQQQFHPPQMQQQQAPSPPVPIAQQQQQPTQYPPPQTNQPYGAQPPRPEQFPPPNNQTYQPGTYPLQCSQTIPGQPVQLPPPSPQNKYNQTYSNGMGHPGAYPPGPQPMTQKSPVYSNEPIKPAAYPPYAHQPMPAQQSPVNFPPPAHQASPAVQFQQSNGPQVQYMSVSNPNGSAVPGIPMPSQGQAWTSELFDCMNDPMNALVTAFFPCLTFGQVAEIIDEGHTSCATSGMLYGGIAFCIGLPFIMSCTYRTKLRNKFGLPEAPAPDWITHFLCEWCALCQEYRELQARGWDPSIGWQGNIARNQNMNLQQATMMAPMNQRMMA